MGTLTYIVVALPFVIWLIKCIVFRFAKKQEWWEVKMKNNFVDCIGYTFGIAFLWSYMMFFMAGISVWPVKEYQITKSVDYDIISSAQADKTEGVIFLFGGYVDSRPVYKAYKVNEDGSYSMVWMYAETTKIVETNKVHPHITEYLEGDRNVKWWTTWHRLTIGDKDSRAYKRLIHSKKLEHNGIIYIPIGTIKPTFDGMNL